MPQFYTLLTDTGQAKLANAVALGGTIEITELAIGDGNGSLPAPDSSAVALVNEVRRAPINTSQTDPDNPSWIVVEQVLPPDVGGWTIREIGIFDVDGDLIGIGNYPETYKPVLAEGSSRTQTVRFVLEVSDTGAVTLKVDPSVVLATREYVDQERTEHEASRNHPPATTTAQGMVEKATTAEAKAGAVDKFADAAGLLAAIQQFGIGLSDVPYAAVDLIAPGTPTGIFAYTSGSTNAPDGADDYGAALVLNRQESTGQKTLIATSFKTRKLYFRTLVDANDYDSGWRTFLHDKDMGAGSGIDAEFLEGQAAAFYRNAGNLNAGTVPVARLPGATTFSKGAVEKALLSEAKSGAVDKFIDGAGLHEAINQYGLGLDGMADYTGDLNTLVENGTYAVGATATNRPPQAGGASGVVVVLSRTAGRRYQVFHATSGGQGVYYREETDVDVWSGWLEVVHSGNVDAFLAGSMPSTLAETGSQQLPGGLIFQWVSVNVAADSTANAPFEFAFPNAVIGHALGMEYVGSGGAGECTVNVTSLTETGVSVQSRRNSGTGDDTLKVTVFALGN